MPKKKTALRAHLKTLKGEDVTIAYSNGKKEVGHVSGILDDGKRYVLLLMDEDGDQQMVQYPNACVQSLTLKAV